MFDFVCKLSFVEDNFIEIVAIILALITFITERYFNAKGERKNSKYDWFLNIIVQPNLHDIDAFYVKTDNQLREACKDLQDRDSTLQDEDYLVEARKYCNKFKKDRREFFNNFVSMIGAFDKDMALQVDEIINKLDDCYASAIDFANADVDNDGMIDDVFRNKAELYQTLFKNVS